MSAWFASAWDAWLWPLLLMVIQSAVVMVLLLVFIAFYLLADRKIWAAVQLRRGPNVVGPFGLFQSFADLLKFVFKEPIIPSGANKGVFLLAPFVTAVLALAAWAVIPFQEGWVVADINVGILYIFAISSLGVYGIIMAGWSSNSKYPFLGALRSAAQMVSYEVSLGFVIICVLLVVGSLNLSDIVKAQDTPYGMLGWYWLPLFPMFVIFFVSALAETNRPPFDLPEAESELVAGFAVEYSSTPFLMFFLGEYVAIMTMCSLTTILFLGGWVVADINVGILYIFAISSLGVYGIIMAGWSSNSKYPFLGALRSAAQMVSYEVSLGFVIICVLLVVGSLNLSDIVKAQDTPYGMLGWYWLPLFPMFVIFFVSALAETNRPPFDLPEAESELVAGFAVEYSSTPFLMFFLGEYVAIMTMCSLTTILFLGGWLPPLPFAPFTWVPGVVWFVLKVSAVFFMFAMVKAFVPRYRYDQLMRLGWKVFLPISLVAVVVVAAVLQFTGWGA